MHVNRNNFALNATTNVMCGSLFFSLESCNAHRLVILVYFSLSSSEKDYQKSQTGSNASPGQNGFIKMR